MTEIRIPDELIAPDDGWTDPPGGFGDWRGTGGAPHGLVADATQGQTEFMAAYEAERARRTAEAEAAAAAAAAAETQSAGMVDTTLDPDDAAPAGEGADAAMEAAEDSESAADAIAAEATDAEDALLGDAGTDVLPVAARDEPEPEDQDGATGKRSDVDAVRARGPLDDVDRASDPIQLALGERPRVPPETQPAREREETVPPIDEEQQRRRPLGEAIQQREAWRTPRRLPRNRRSDRNPTEPERAMTRIGPLPESLGIPAYRRSVPEVQSDSEPAQAAALQRFGDDWDMRRSFYRVFVAEGARRRGAGGVCSGFRPTTYAGLRRNYATDPEVSALPDDPCAMTVEQVPIAYEAYLDDTLGKAGGPKALFAAVGPATGDAVIDALFHRGGPGGSEVIWNAIQDTVGEADESIAMNAIPNNWFSPAMLRALTEIVDRGRDDMFRLAVIARHKEVSHEGEYPRIEHFRDLWPPVSSPSRTRDIDDAP